MAAACHLARELGIATQTQVNILCSACKPRTMKQLSNKPYPAHTITAEIPPEREAIVFEVIATMEFPFEGIPTVPPRKDMDHMAFFCSGCRWGGGTQCMLAWAMRHLRLRLRPEAKGGTAVHHHSHVAPT